MAATVSHEEPPSFRRDSPSPDASPSSKALSPRDPIDIDRSASTASSASHGSSTDGAYRHSLGSEAFGSSRSSRQSSSNYSRLSEFSFGSPSRHSTGNFSSMNRSGSKRRGFSRPEGTDFAASAKHRDSVLSLGSIAHLQYYFARTGMLDGKGGQLARKRNPRATLDLSSLESASYLSPTLRATDADSSYASMSTSPDFGALDSMVESPTEEQDGFFSEEWEEPDPDVLPPTASTYKHQEKHVPKPPTMAELKSDLNRALDNAAQVLYESETPGPAAEAPPPEAPLKSPKTKGWCEVQGVQILDVMTLAIRAAKVYYTSHEHPDRLDVIKSEKEIRSELLSVMEVLKHMATRGFLGGMREEEKNIMTSWIEGIRTLLTREQEIEDAEAAERRSWSWLRGDWTGREVEREVAFLQSMLTDGDSLPAYTPIDQASELPTPFLEGLQNGIRLVKLHNAVVRKSKRRFGTIGTFHTDTSKPYRCAENLRYWVKAAELRWEVMLKFDVLGVVYNNNPQVWVDFEQSLWKWCRKVREELAAELEHGSSTSAA